MLDDIRTVDIRIGNSTAGNIAINTWTPAASFASGVVTLDTAGTITQTGAIDLSVSGADFIARDASSVVLSANNNIGNVAASVAGSFVLTNAAANPLTVTHVDG